MKEMIKEQILKKQFISWHFNLKRYSLNLGWKFFLKAVGNIFLPGPLNMPGSLQSSQ